MKTISDLKAALADQDAIVHVSRHDRINPMTKAIGLVTVYRPDSIGERCAQASWPVFRRNVITEAAFENFVNWPFAIAKS